MIESDISEEASQQIEPNKQKKNKQSFVNMLGAVIDVIITWAKTEILIEKTKWIVRVLKVSHSVRLQAYVR